MFRVGIAILLVASLGCSMLSCGEDESEDEIEDEDDEVIIVSVSGYVKDEQKEPVRDVEVFVKGLSFRATTDEQGYFLIEDIQIDDFLLDNNPWTLGATYSASDSEISVEVSFSFQDRDFQIKDIILTDLYRLKVKGYIYDTESGLPIPGVKVHVGRPIDRGSFRSFVSDVTKVDGWFQTLLVERVVKEEVWQGDSFSPTTRTTDIRVWTRKEGYEDWGKNYNLKKIPQDFDIGSVGLELIKARGLDADDL